MTIPFRTECFQTFKFRTFGMEWNMEWNSNYTSMKIVVRKHFENT